MPRLETTYTIVHWIFRCLNGVNADVPIKNAKENYDPGLRASIGGAKIARDKQSSDMFMKFRTLLYSTLRSQHDQQKEKTIGISIYL